MPPKGNAGPSQKPKAFKPPRPVSKPTASKKAAATKAAKKSKKAPSPIPSDSDPDASSDLEPNSPSTTLPAPDDSAPLIPENLLEVILQQHFEDPATSLNPDAKKLVAKYMETFVREAIARAVVERKGSVEEGGGGGGGIGGDFLEVEDLEKLAPQLILDF